VLDYLVQYNVPHIAPTTGSGLLARPTRPNIFCAQPSYTIEGTLLAQYALDTLGSKTFAVLFQNDAFGKEGLDAIQAELQKRNLAAATEVAYETTDRNYSAQALRLQSSGADTVILFAIPQSGGSVVAEMTRIGFKPRLLSSSVMNDPVIFDLSGPGIDGMLLGSWLPDYADLTDPKVAAFQAWMRENAPNEQAAGFAEIGYMQAQITTELLKRTGKDLTRERFIQAANALQDYTGSMVPSLSYTPEDHRGVKAMYFQRAVAAEKRFTRITDYIELK
jgi:ABC-type branched-subunit amino acid transport system substrate-binding protein